jgi:peroxiredoxin Q/BCP
MKTNGFTALLIAGSILFSTAAAFAAMPQAGDAAPSFAGQDQNGKTVKLTDLIGKKIVLLYFYPQR